MNDHKKNSSQVSLTTPVPHVHEPTHEQILQRLHIRPDALTIQPGDKLRPGSCSRCGGVLGQRVVIAVWNGAQYPYCEACIAYTALVPTVCPTCGRVMEVKP